jgi:hypothetical protein
MSFETGDEKQDIPLYKEHVGTIRVAGHTAPLRAARCALHFLERQILPIEFMCIGGNAGQQATKSMSILCYMVNNSKEFTGIEVAFQPHLFKTVTVDPITKEEREKSVTIWTAMIFEKLKKI